MAVTAVVVVVLAVVLTVWRHNGSTYLTGFWDNGSQTLVFGRMLQMQQNQSSPGGFMGVDVYKRQQDLCLEHYHRLSLTACPASAEHF